MAKSYDYIIELKKQNHFFVDGISRLMLVAAIAAFGYTLFLLNAIGELVSRYGAVMAALVIGMVYWLIHCSIRRKKTGIAYYRLGLLFATIGWAMLAQSNHFAIFYMMAVFYFIAVISEKQVKFPREIAFDQEGIVINSLPRRSYRWSELANVVLKDHILTIDFKNNKIIQQQTASDTSVADEQEFTAFCRTKLVA